MEEKRGSGLWGWPPCESSIESTTRREREERTAGNPEGGVRHASDFRLPAECGESGCFVREKAAVRTRLRAMGLLRFEDEDDGQPSVSETASHVSFERSSPAANDEDDEELRPGWAGTPFSFTLSIFQRARSNLDISLGDSPATI